LVLSKFLIRKKEAGQNNNQLALQLQFFLSSIDAILEVSHCQSEGISWTYTSNTSQDVKRAYHPWFKCLQLSNATLLNPFVR